MSVAQEVFNVTTSTVAKSVTQTISGTAPGCVLLASVITQGAPLSTPTDTLGLTWNAGPSTTLASPSRSFQLWWALNTAGGNTTVQGNWTNSTSNYAIFVTELDGVQAALDGSTGNSQSTGVTGANCWVSGNASNSGAPALLYSICWSNLSNNANMTSGTGFTKISNAAGSSGFLGGSFTTEYASLSSPGSQQATFTNNGGAQTAITLMVMFDILSVAVPGQICL